MKNFAFGLVLAVASFGAYTASASSVREQWHSAQASLEVMSDGSAEITMSCSYVSIPSGEWNEDGKPMKAFVRSGVLAAKPVETPVTVTATPVGTGDKQLQVAVGHGAALMLDAGQGPEAPTCL